MSEKGTTKHGESCDARLVRSFILGLAVQDFIFLEHRKARERWMMPFDMFFLTVTSAGLYALMKCFHGIVSSKLRLSRSIWFGAIVLAYACAAAVAFAY